METLLSLQILPSLPTPHAGGDPVSLHPTEPPSPWNTALRPLQPHLMVWLMMMGSGCCSSPASFMGISEKRMRTQLKI